VLSDAMIVPAVAVADLDRAKQFYGRQVGLPILDETPFTLRFGCGAGTQIAVRRGTPNVGQTVAHFEVADIEGAIAELQSRGVMFDDYETPKTVNFIAQLGPARGAWFRDPDGNVLGLREGPLPGVAESV
jgi:catechol 2,3-dioxygenase-like lactoylglutathione lyase family enzyme